MAQLKKAGVITGDVIGSSGLTPAARKKLQAAIDDCVSEASKRWPDLSAQQYRGDSVQITMLQSRAFTLRAALLLQSRLIAQHFGIRIAVGIGDISYASKDVVTSDGSAFRASGPYLDEMKKRSEVLSIAGDEETFTNEWQVHSASLNFLVTRWSQQQAEAISLQLSDLTQEEIAAQLKIAQPSVHQRLQLAGWTAIQKILQRFETVAA